MAHILIMHSDGNYAEGFCEFVRSISKTEHTVKITMSIAEALSILSVGHFDKIFLSANLPLHHRESNSVKDTFKFTSIISRIIPELEIFVHASQDHANWFKNCAIIDLDEDFSSIGQLMGLELSRVSKNWSFEELVLAEPNGQIIDAYGLEQPEVRGQLLTALRQNAANISQGLGEATLGSLTCHDKEKSFCARLDEQMTVYGLTSVEESREPKDVWEKFEDFLL